MLFSIIIPCYNAELWLEECLKSIIAQNYKDWEMLLINDGSIDGTERILHSYSEKDTRIKVISQKNQGVSAARNRAIKEAKGDYMMFLDSDDYYRDKYCLEQMAVVVSNKNVDIIVFRYHIIQNGNKAYKKEKLKYFKDMKGCKYTGEEYLRSVLSQEEVYPWYPFIYAFKRGFWVQNKFQFNNGYEILEDMDLIYKVILKARKIDVLDNPIYQYRIREESASHLITKKSIQSKLNICKKNIDTVNNMNIDNDMKILLNGNFSYNFFQILVESNYLPKKDKKETFKILNQNFGLMKYTIRKRNIFLRRLANILGLRIVAKLLYINQIVKTRK